MNSELDAVRRYVQELVADGVMYITPSGIANGIGCSPKDALDHLAVLDGENIVGVRGLMPCPDCGHPVLLRSRQLEALSEEAKALQGRSCSNCGARWLSAKLLRVDLSFFCPRLPKTARRPGQEGNAQMEGVPSKEPDRTIAMPVDDIVALVRKAAESRGIHASHGATINIQQQSGGGNAAALASGHSTSSASPESRPASNSETKLKLWVAIITLAGAVIGGAVVVVKTWPTTEKASSRPQKGPIP